MQQYCGPCANREICICYIEAKISHDFIKVEGFKFSIKTFKGLNLVPRRFFPLKSVSIGYEASKTNFSIFFCVPFLGYTFLKFFPLLHVLSKPTTAV